MLRQRPSSGPASRGTCACSAGGHRPCESCSAQRPAMLQHASVPGTRATLAPPVTCAARGTSGAPLDATTRGYMESRFGHDFTRVRVHAGPDAAEATRAVNARAYTVGSDIVFGA